MPNGGCELSRWLALIINVSGAGGQAQVARGEIVDGLVHSRLTAQKVRKGQLTLPPPGSLPTRSRPRGPIPARAGSAPTRR